MKDYLPFIVVGLVSGSIYGLAGVGLVLTYKTSGVFNFAQGAIAAVAAFIFYELHFAHDWPWPIAFLVTALGFGLVAGLVLERLARLLAGVRPVLTVVATVGLLVAIQAALDLHTGGEIEGFPQFLPTETVRLFDVNVEYSQIIVAVFVAVVTAGLYLLFRSTRQGAAMRAVVDSPDLLGLSGTNPASVRRMAWIIGSTFAAITGLLIAPSIGLQASVLTLLVVQAFGAAAVGRFSSLPLTYLGGLLVGLLVALTRKWVAPYPNLGGLPEGVPFFVLFVALLVTPKGRLLDWVGSARRSSPGEPLPPVVGRAALLVAVGLALLVPVFIDTKLPTYTNAAIFVVVFLSLALLVSLSGQVSLCHAAFTAVGATTMAHLTTGAGLPWPVALVGAGLATVPIGAFLAIPAIRLSGIYLALATFGFGILIEQFAYGFGVMFGHLGQRVAQRPSLGDGPVSDETYYYVVVAVAVLAGLLVLAVNRSRLGRTLRCLADSPVGLATSGASINVSLVLAFCLSAFLAGVAGALMASATGGFSRSGFGPFQSLTWLAVLGIFGAGLFRPAILAAVALTIPISYLTDVDPAWLSLLFGLAALISVLVTGGERTLAARAGAVVARTSGRIRHSPARERVPAAAAEGVA